MLDTKDRIANAAEKIFAEKGFYNSSTRELTSMAGVNLSAINYHFGSKEKLFEAVLKRRLEPINEQRMELLNTIIQRCDKEGARPGIKELFHAFFRPVWDSMVDDDNAKNFLMMMVGVIHDPDNKLRNKFFDIMKPVIIVFFDQACKAQPELDKGIVFIRAELSIGSFFHGMRMMFPQDSEDFQALHNQFIPDKETYFTELIDFITRGTIG